MYFFDLKEIELARKYYDIGELGIEAQGLHIGNAELGGYVHLKTDLAAICYGCHV